MYGCEQKRATRFQCFSVGRFYCLAAHCHGQHVHKLRFPCNFGAASCSLCQALVDVLVPHCSVDRLAVPSSATTVLAEDIRMTAGVQQRGRRHPPLLPEFEEVFVVDAPSSEVGRHSLQLRWLGSEVRPAHGTTYSSQWLQPLADVGRKGGWLCSVDFTD